MAWLLIWDVLFEMAYAGGVPYGAWMAELFTEEERPKLSQFMNTFSFLGTGIMAVFSTVILASFALQLTTNPNELPLTYSLTLMIFALIYLAGFYLNALFMPIEPSPKTPPDLMQNLKDIWKNHNFWLISLMQGVASLAWIMVTNVMLPYTSKVLGFSTIEYVLAGVVLLLGVFFALYVWRKVLARYGKKKALLGLFAVSAAVLSCSLFGLIPFKSTLVFGLLFILGIGASLGGWYLLSAIWYADLAEDDTKRTEHMRAGLYIGLPSILLNAFQAVGTHDIIEDKLGHVQGPMLSHAGQTCFGYRIARTAILHAAL